MNPAGGGRRAWGLAAIGLVAAIALWHGAGGMPYFRDRLWYFLPQYDACRQALHAGEVPLWNPYVNCGQPLLATWQVGLGSPFSLPFLLLPWDRAVPLFWLLVLPFAAAGTYALGLRAGLQPFGAAVAAVVYAGAAPLRTLGEWPNIVVSLACLPALLAAGVDLIRGRPGAAAAVGLLAALQVLAGQPRQVIMAALTFALWLLALAADRAERARGRRGVPGALAVAAGVALAVSAVQLIPTIELYALSDRRRSGVPLATVRESFLHLSDLGTLLLARFWGGEDRILDPHRLLTPRLYFGWLGLLLAGIAAVSERGLVWRFALLSLPAALLVSTGGPVFDAAMRLTGHEDPTLRYLGHLVLIAWPGVCLLAGLGAQRLLSATGHSRAAAGWSAAGAAAAALVWWTPLGRILVVALLGTDSPWAAGHLRNLRVDAAVAAAAVLAAWLVACRIRGREGLRRAALLAVMAADLGWAAHAHEAKAPASAFGRPPVLDRQPLDRGRVFSPTWPLNFQVFDDDSPRTQLEHYQARWNLLTPNVPGVFLVHNVHGYEPFRPAACRELFGAFDDSLGTAASALEVTGVRRMLGPLPLAPPGWRVCNRIAGAWGVLEPPHPYRQVRVVPAGAFGVPWQTLASLLPAGTGDITSETWNTLDLAVESRRDALVTPTTPWYPGWRAEVNGARRPVVRAGTIFLAVGVPAGQSRIRLEYVPLSFALGLFASALALGALAACALPQGADVRR